MSLANTTSKKLIFVYNAKSGFMHSVMDLVHKTASPKTYPCKLCMVTFSGATMNKLWKQYVANLGVPFFFIIAGFSFVGLNVIESKVERLE